MGSAKQAPKAGPVFEIARPLLEDQPRYRAFQQGGDRAAFAEFLDTIATDLVAAGLPPEDVHFAKRYPRNAARFVNEMLEELAARGIIPGVAYDERRYEELDAAMRANYSHGGFRTYIYPEEKRLLFAVVEIVRPKSVVFLGSYYGYWAHAALAALVGHGGRAVLVDPDPRAQDVARRNLAAAGLSSVEVAVMSGQEFADKAAGPYDLVVLDAEGPRDHPDPEQRGKRIYTPLLRHILPHLTGDALMACHNILFQDIAGCSFFDGILERNHAELDEFMSLASAEFSASYECPSTEGVGFWRRGPTA
jgi:predicted O-methyltransferase YrrM